MFTLYKNAMLYAPESLGMKEILICGEKIVQIADSIDCGNLEVAVVDLKGKIMTPGLIDQHVHTIGGGGQTGYFSLAAELPLSKLIATGTTTVMGLLGTDGCVKQLPQLYAKTKAFDMDGITAYMLTGFYNLPSPTLTDSVAEDLIFIDKVIGCKIAISDDRSVYPTELELLRTINQVRLGGFTSGKGGIMHVHLGALESGMQILVDIAKKYPSLISYISPTHVGRTQLLFNQAKEFARLGGMIDISTGGTKYCEPYECVLEALADGVSIDKMTFSSDGNAGVRKIDAVKGIDTYTLAPLHLNLEQVVKLVKVGNLPPEQAFKLLTTNPARNLKIKNKGEIAVGYDADLCVFNEDYTLDRVVARGRTMMENGIVIKKGNFEQ